MLLEENNKLEMDCNELKELIAIEDQKYEEVSVKNPLMLCVINRFFREVLTT